MGPRFDRWLARPLTLHFLRQLLVPADRETLCSLKAAGSGSHVTRRSTATAAVALSLDNAEQRGQQGHATSRHRPSRKVCIRKGDFPHSLTELLGSSTREYGLRASLSAGVPLFDPTLPMEGTFEALRQQADVNADYCYGTLLVDEKEHRGNYRLWIEVLRYRQRIDDLRGLLDVWYGMRRRDIDLPTEGDAADVLWKDFASIAPSASPNHEGEANNFRHELLRYAVDLKARTGKSYGSFYRVFVAPLFHSNAETATYWHLRVMATTLAFERPLRSIAPDLVQNASLYASRRAFRQLYKRSGERDLYDVFVPLVLAKTGVDETLKWHRLFLQNGDGPSQEVFATKEVQKLFEKDGDRSLPMKRELEAEVAVSPTVKYSTTQYPPVTRSSMSSLVGDVHGIKPKEISDGFVAKMFATRAFSLDLVIRGLSFFSIDALGPLSVQQIAVRSSSLINFSNKLNSLREMEIQLTDAMYCRLLHRIAAEGSTELFEAVLKSDQHPESFDDLKTQDKLLVHFLKTGAYAQAQLTARCLTVAGVEMEGKMLNRLLQHQLEVHSWQMVEHSVQQIQAIQAPLSSTTLLLMYRHLLPPRNKGQRPSTQRVATRPQLDALSFVTNACIYNTQVRHGRVFWKFWVELLKRHGMRHKFADVEKLVRFLTMTYAPKLWAIRTVHDDDEGKEDEVQVSTQETPLLCKILSPQMQQAILIWGLRSAGEKWQLHPHNPQTELKVPSLPSPAIARRTTALTIQPWAQGLAVLHDLKQQNIPIDIEAIQSAFVTRMWILFGPGHSKRPINEVARQRNHLRLAEYVIHANQVWPDFVPDIRPELLEPGAVYEGLLRLAFFGRYRKAWKRYVKDEATGTLWREGEQDYVDVGAWADDVMDGRDRVNFSYRQRRGRRIRTKLRDTQYLRSPYRRVASLEAVRKLELRERDKKNYEAVATEKNTSPEA